MVEFDIEWEQHQNTWQAQWKQYQITASRNPTQAVHATAETCHFPITITIEEVLRKTLNIEPRGYQITFKPGKLARHHPNRMHFKEPVYSVKRLGAHTTSYEYYPTTLGRVIKELITTLEREIQEQQL